MSVKIYQGTCLHKQLLLVVELFGLIWVFRETNVRLYITVVLLSMCILVDLFHNTVALKSVSAVYYTYDFSHS